MPYTTLFSSNSELQAQSIKSLLEGYGIQVRILDDNHITIDPFIAQAIGGVKVQVKPSDHKEAFEILRASGYMDSNETVESDHVSFITELDNLANKIPLINKLGTTAKLFSTLILAISLFMIIVSLFISEKVLL